MGNDMTIGNKRKHTAATIIHGIDIVSQNKDEYWISGSDLFLDVDITISKNTEEGQRLKELIDIGDKNKVKLFLDRVLCKNYPTGLLMEVIKDSQTLYFQNGKKTAKREIRQALGL